MKMPTPPQPMRVRPTRWAALAALAIFCAQKPGTLWAAPPKKDDRKTATKEMAKDPKPAADKKATKK